MRVEQLGDGTPEIAVVGGIHGDEPCGVRAVEGLLEDRPPVERPVKLIIANEAAIDQNERYLDTDLNRAFPGDPDAADHEASLAAELTEALEGCTVLALHSTQSYAEPFAIVPSLEGPLAESVCPQLAIAAVVEPGPFIEGRLLSSPATFEVECGLQGSTQAAENAVRIVREFFTATGVLAGETITQEVPTFRLTQTIPKALAEEYEVFAENFERVDSGEVYAAADGDTLQAEQPFYPVLLSANGYVDVFGYAAERVGQLS